MIVQGSTNITPNLNALMLYASDQGSIAPGLFLYPDAKKPPSNERGPINQGSIYYFGVNFSVIELIHGEKDMRTNIDIIRVW